MKIVVAAPDDLWNELNTTIKNQACIRVSHPDDFAQHTGDTIFFNLFDGAETLTYHVGDALVFINCHLKTLSESDQPKNIYRVNAWNGFLMRETWEIAGLENINLTDFFVSIDKGMILLPDIPGFISSRIISMIINEAYLTLEEGVSTKSEIDIAMKLGTNYPKGPFEWSEEIGLKKVHELLLALAQDDACYTPAPLLIKESL